MVFWTVFGRTSLSPWWGMPASEDVIRNLSVTKENSHWGCSSHSISKGGLRPVEVELGDWIALDYVLAEQGGVCALTNKSHRPGHQNTSGAGHPRPTRHVQMHAARCRALPFRQPRGLQPDQQPRALAALCLARAGAGCCQAVRRMNQAGKTLAAPCQA